MKYQPENTCARVSFSKVADCEEYTGRRFLEKQEVFGLKNA